MKSLRLDRWASQLQPPRNPRSNICTQRCLFSTHDTRPQTRERLQRRAQSSTPQYQLHRKDISGRRRASTATAVRDDGKHAGIQTDGGREPLLNFPRHRQAVNSAKLAALHSRLSLPKNLPLQTLARCLIDPSVDSRPGYNNAPLATVGQDVLAYHTSEYLICKYPRLPMPVLFAAQYAYVGPATLFALRSEWGVESAAVPGPEVEPGLLQFLRLPAGNSMADDGKRRLKDMPQANRIRSLRKGENFRRGMSSRIVYDDQFGDLLAIPEQAPYPGAPVARKMKGDGEEAEVSVDTSLQEPIDMDTQPVTSEAASAGFVRALTGALYLHAGSQAAKEFHQAHILSRHLELHTMFDFTHPTRDLSRLCAREGFEPPVARLISETGRLSRSPVFIVGVFSGNDKLGEGAGSSLNEGRIRAAAAALRAWYLYSPQDTDIVFPSDVEGAGAGKKTWKPQMIDIGEIVT